MASSVTLTSAVRSNLLALQDTSTLQATTQQRLATGKKVNSALDNPTNYFTAAALTARAGELTNLLDSMTNGINVIKAASNGLDSITTTLQSMQATVTQARQDASWQSASYTIDSTTIGTAGAKNISFYGGATSGTSGAKIDISLNGVSSRNGAGGLSNGATSAITTAGNLTIQAADLNGGASFSVSIDTTDTLTSAAAKINTAAGQTIASAGTAGLVFTDNAAMTMTISSDVAANGTELGIGGTTAVSTGAVTVGSAVHTVDQLVTQINNNASLSGFVKASNNAGQLQITNLSTSGLSVTGANNVSGKIDGSTSVTASVAGNSTRSNLVTQFNQLKDQLDKTAVDSSFNGINLLNGDSLKLYFNETSTSSLTIQSTNSAGINASVLGQGAATNAEFQSNTSLDARLQSLHTALTTVASQASAFGSNLSIVQNRQTFTNNMVNTLTTGADGLTLADGNLEGANMLALQTRQQLSIQALSLASQANQAVMRLFG